MGKSTLLQRLIEDARGAGWSVVNLDPGRPTLLLARLLVSSDETLQRAYSPESIDATWLETVLLGDLPGLLAYVTATKGEKVLIAIDEAHVMPAGEITRLGRAIQRAAREGGNVACLFAAPSSGRFRLIGRDDSNLVLWAHSEELGPLGFSEVRDEFAEALASVEGLSVGPGVVDGLLREVEEEEGFPPYLLQWLGATAVEGAHLERGCFVLTLDDVSGIAARARAGYDEVVLPTIATRAHLVGREGNLRLAEWNPNVIDPKLLARLEDGGEEEPCE